MNDSGPSAPSKTDDLRRLALFERCDEAVLGPILAAMDIVRLRKRSTSLVTDASGRVAIVWAGRLRICMVSPAGIQVILINAEAGDCIGLAAALLSFDPGERLRIIADAASVLLVLPSEAVRAAARACPNLAEALFTALAGQVVDHSARVYELSALDVRARLQAELLRVARRGLHRNGALVVEDAPTQALLAAQIGAGREAVTRHLRDLQDEGLIAFKRGKIEFPNLAKLEHLDRVQAGRNLWNARRRS